MAAAEASLLPYRVAPVRVKLAVAYSGSTEVMFPAVVTPSLLKTPALVRSALVLITVWRSARLIRSPAVAVCTLMVRPRGLIAVTSEACAESPQQAQNSEVNRARYIAGREC